MESPAPYNPHPTLPEQPQSRAEMITLREKEKAELEKELQEQLAGIKALEAELEQAKAIEAETADKKLGERMQTAKTVAKVVGATALMTTAINDHHADPKQHFEEKHASHAPAHTAHAPKAETPSTSHERKDSSLDEAFHEIMPPIVARATDTAKTETPPPAHEQKDTVREGGPFVGLEKIMNVEFFTTKLTTPAEKLMYLEWIRDNLEKKEMAPFTFLVNKDKAFMYILDTHGNPSPASRTVIVGAERGDGVKPGMTPGGDYDIYPATDPNELMQHPVLFYIDVPAPGNQSLHYNMHDTLYTMPSDVQSSALRSTDPSRRKLSDGCLRYPGMDDGALNPFLAPRTVTQKDESGKMVKMQVYPKLRIAPQEHKPGKIRIADEKRDGKMLDITPEEYKKRVDSILGTIKSLAK